MKREYIRSTVRGCVNQCVQEMTEPKLELDNFELKVKKAFEEGFNDLTLEESDKVLDFFKEAIKSKHSSNIMYESDGAITTKPGSKTWTLDAGDDIYIITRTGSQSHGVRLMKNGDYEDFEVSDPYETVEELMDQGAVLIRDKAQIKRKFGVGGFMRAIAGFIRYAAMAGGLVASLGLMVYAVLSIVMPIEVGLFIAKFRLGFAIRDLERMIGNTADNLGIF